MSEPRVAASIVPWVREGSGARLLWAKRSREAPALPGFHVCPGGLLDDADARAPHDGGDTPRLRVAGLRELFEETGILHVEGPTIEVAERGALRQAFQDSSHEGHARLLHLGLRWRTRELVPTGRWITPAFARRRFDTHLFGLQLEAAPTPDPDLLELEELEWIAAVDALDRWSRGGCLIGPPLARLLRSMSERGALHAADLRGVYGARGEPSLRWEVVPWVQMMPFRTPTLPPATMTNSFLVGSGEAVVIEPATPYPDEQDRFVRWVEEARRDGLTVRAILATHHHGDHIGGARALGERLGLPLWAHAATAQRLGTMADVDRTLEDGERIELAGPRPVSLRAVHTPGHAPGHLCFFEERSGVLIAGDMVASIGTIIVEPTDGDMAVYLESLQRMADMHPSMLLPAHGLPVQDPQALLAHYIHHRLAREAKILAALEAHGGAATAMDLVPVAYDDAPKAVWPLAAMSTEAHLIKLGREGRAVQEASGWRAVG